MEIVSFMVVGIVIALIGMIFTVGFVVMTIEDCKFVRSTKGNYYGVLGNALMAVSGVLLLTSGIAILLTSGGI